jgi:hypothetical protein
MTWMTEAAPAPLETRYAFTLTVDIAPAIEVGDVGFGNRRLISITGGELNGPGISGTILPAGADFMMVRPGRTVEVNARYVIQMDDGANVYIENTGIRTGPKDEAERLKRNEAIGPDEIYFRTAPRFETASEKYRWLMEHIFVARAGRRPGGVFIEVHRVL